MSALKKRDLNLDKAESILGEILPLIGVDLRDQIKLSITEWLSNVGNAHGSGIDTVFGYNRHCHTLEGIIVSHEKCVFPGLRLC